MLAEEAGIWVDVYYNLSDKGRILAVRKGLQAQRDQQITLEDPTRKIIDLPEFSVDEKGRPFIELVEWTRLFGGQPHTKKATIDASIQTIEEVFKFSAEAQKKRKKWRSPRPPVSDL
jgi:hypothetical protein